ncbi:MAG: c-type cytochrome [Betaproteobacteria bacterium]
MSEVHVEDHQSLIKTPQQLIVVIVLSFLIPVVGIIMIASYVTGGLKVDEKNGDASPASIAQRLKPVGTLVVGEAPAPAANAPAAGAPSAGAATASASPAVKTASGEAVKTGAGGASAGKQLYESICVACHGAGIAGAPKAGDKAAWQPRIAKGKDSLYTSALKGKNLMPPKGGSTAPDADIKAAVDYMVGLAK